MEPQLSVDYGSGSGNSIFGLGFDVSIPAISRKTSKGIPTYTENDTYLLSGADELVAVEDTQTSLFRVIRYQPRVEGLFAKIEQFIDSSTQKSHWQVVTKENITHLYGYTPAGRIYDPENEGHIFKWLLEESFDAKGSHICYRYKAENLDGISSESFEKNRSHSANKYIQSIQYGNKISAQSRLIGQPIHASNWHFEVVFDYGEYDLDPANLDIYTPVKGRSWKARLDPFSNYNAGFEIRTHRLCQNILMFHRFEDRFGTAPILVWATQFRYDENLIMSRLEGVTHVGYRYRTGKPYETRKLPPLSFGYTSFDPDVTPHAMDVAEPHMTRSLVGLNQSPNYQLIDLYGEGLPGIFYGDGQTTLYWEPNGETSNNGGTASFTMPDKPHTWPVSRHSETATQHLLDLNGNGRPDLIWSSPAIAGYFESNPDKTWTSFRPFRTFPTDYLRGHTHTVDVTGDGLADIVSIEGHQVKVYPSLGLDGFAQAITTSQSLEFPLPKGESRTATVRFADIFGTGQQHLVRVTRNQVECWASLGYGRFDDKVVLADAPDFGAHFDAERLFLTDIDGSGTPDLAYLPAERPDQIEIWFNQGGNSFATQPLIVMLPHAYDHLDQISFADLFGNGTNCLIFSENAPAPRHWFYDFCGKQKPYLLNELDNNMGVKTEITYKSSVSFYLEDKQNDFAWITTLPFPVQVVAQVTHRDLINQNTQVTAYRYHHGFYDPFEREFRGFGQVERTDTSTFEAFLPSEGSRDAAYNASPRLTKTWYHTGAWNEDQSLEQQYKKEYWLGDPQPHQLPPTTFVFDARQPPDDDNLREAFRALHGAVQRVEVYGSDGTAWQENPYTVTETQFKVIQLRSRGSQKYSVFLTHEQETISLDYERNPADARVGHEFILKVDLYGEMLERCAIHYGRRAGQQKSMDRQSSAQQTGLRALYAKHDYLNVTDDFYLIGVPLSQMTYELTGITAGGYLTLDEVSQFVYASVGSIQKRLLSWERDYYYDAEQNVELPFGQVTAQSLHCRTEIASIEKHSINADFADAPHAIALDQLLATGDKYAIGGYITYQDAEAGAYYWNPGEIEIYGAVDEFSQTKALYSPSQYRNQSNNVRTTYQYDPSYLAVVKTTDPLGHETTAEIDYQVIRPWRVTDANGNVTEIQFDPLGTVRASSFYGTEGQAVVGFGELTSIPDGGNDDFEDVLANPARYLAGQAASYFYYDLDAWMRRKEPVRTVQLIAEAYTRNRISLPAPATQVQIHVTHFDGFGRTLQTKQKVTEPGEAYTKVGETYPLQQSAAERWLTTGVVRYNNKGSVIQQFEPYFVDTPAYTPHQVGVSVALFYDALDREVLLEVPVNRTALGQSWLTCFSKTLFGELVSGEAPAAPETLSGYLNQKLYGGLSQRFVPSAWSMLHFDENQTLKESTYYRAVMDDALLDQALPPEEKETLSATAGFHNHASQHILDNLEQPVELLQLDAGDNTVKAVAGSQTYSRLDVLGDTLTESDLRLHARNKANLEMRYDLVKRVVKTVSADAGVEWVLHDVEGNPILTQDGRGTVIKRAYDDLQRPTQVYVENQSEKLGQVVEITVYGDTQIGGQPLVDPSAARQWNLRGKPVLHFDQSGLTLCGLYTIHGLPLAGSQCLHKVIWLDDRLAEVDWGAVDETILRALGQRLLGITPDTVRSLTLSGVNLPDLESTVYTAQTDYDALSRPIRETDPDENTTNIAYNSRGLVQAVTTIPGARAGGISAPSIKALSYNAKGQHEKIVLGNDVEISCTYDPFTFQLRTIRATRPGESDLQDLTYTYDPAGNVTYLADMLTPTIFYKGAVSPDAAYAYDSLYRLISATGREQASMVSNVQQNRNRSNQALFSVLSTQLMNPQAVQRYTQTFDYDEGGNLTQIQHSTGSTQQHRIQPESNRLLSSKVGAKRALTFKYDANGNQQNFALGRSVYWNYRNNIQSVTLMQHKGLPDDVEGYVYDSSGRRVRKVRRVILAKGTVQRVTEVIYLGRFEIRRSWQAPADLPYDSGTPKAEWHWSRLGGGHDDKCRWGYPVHEDVKASKPAQIRYQLTNQLESSVMEINERAQVIAYEAYYPYGGTAFIAGKGKSLGQAQVEVNARCYRYSGKELDEATGLYYYGMRYYAPWLCRWLNPDPAGTVDGLNLYRFVAGNPSTHLDIGGMGSGKPANIVNARYKKGKKAATYSFSKQRMKDRFVFGGNTTLLKYMKAEARGKISKANQMLRKYKAYTTVVNKVATATPQWLNSQKALHPGAIVRTAKGRINARATLAKLDPPLLPPYHMGSKKPGITVNPDGTKEVDTSKAIPRASRIITTPYLDAKGRGLSHILRQDVDEAISRGLGGKTISYGAGDNQGPLNSDINSLYGGADSRMEDRGVHEEIEMFRIKFK